LASSFTAETRAVISIDADRTSARMRGWLQSRDVSEPDMIEPAPRFGRRNRTK
jgi:hypothetical protein